jgi:hypothetical protein
VLLLDATEYINIIIASYRLLLIGVPDELNIVSDEESMYSDQYTLQWTVRSLSPLLNTQISLKLVRLAIARFSALLT